MTLARKTTQPTVLLVALVPGHGGMHLPRRLARHGLRVAFIGSDRAMASQSGHIAERFAWQWDQPPLSYDPLLAAMDRLRPACVIPLDELAALRLEQVGRGVLDGTDRPFPPWAVGLVRASLGDPAGYVSSVARSACHAIAQQAGIAVPGQAAIQSADDLVAFAARTGWPVVLKREMSMGGAGVFLLADEAQARTQCALQKVGASRVRWIAQCYVQGDLAMHTVLAKDGRVLAGVSALQLQRRSAGRTSPSSVVRLCRHPAIDDAVQRYTAQAGLTGFHAWDFIVQGDAPPVLIEHNARPITVSTLGGLVGSDLCAALATQVGATPARDPLPSTDSVDVALFPDEWLRDAHSPWLQRAVHDAPWDDRKLFAAVLADDRNYG